MHRTTTTVAEIQTPKVTARVHMGRYPAFSPVSWLDPAHVLVFSARHYVGTAFSDGHDAKPLGGLGSVFFLPAATPVQFEGEGGPIRSFHFCYPGQAFDWEPGLPQSWPDEMWRGCLNIRSASVAAMLRRGLQELEAPGFASATLLEGLGAVALVDVARHLGQSAAPPARPARLAPWQLRRLTDYVESVEGAAPGVAELARLCGLSRSHFHRAFRQTTGRSVYAYVQEVRLDKACTLLTGTDLPLKEIALRLGFASASGFTIAFKRALCETPSQMRRRLRPAASVS